MSNKTRKLFIRIMCAFLALLMVGSLFMTVLYSCVG